MKVLFFIVIVFLSYCSVTNSEVTECSSVVKNYNSAILLNQLKSQIRNVLIYSNITGQDTNPGFQLTFPVDQSQLLANRIERSQILITTATLLQQNLPCQCQNIAEELLSASACLPTYPTANCTPKKNSKYRPVDGKLTDRCTNGGKSFEPYERIEKAHYSDCLWDMPKAKSRNELPKPRSLVNEILRNFKRELCPNTRLPNFLITMMGQYIAHDMGSRANVQVGNQSLECCSTGNEHPLPIAIRHAACCPIELPKDDPDYKKFKNVHCLNFIRSELMAKDLNKLAPAEQMNEVTPFLDNSNLYGNDKTVADSLRTWSGGQMVTDSANVLPVTADGNYFLGDGRLNQTPQLCMIHSVYLREHNRIAKILAKLNRHWNDDKIYEETRRIVIAQYQHMIYNEFLPTFLDTEFVKYLEDPKFDSREDVGTYNEFEAAVFRAFHSFIPTKIQLISKDGTVTTYNISQVLFNQKLIKTHYDDICRGMLLQPLNPTGYDPDLFHGLFTNSPDVPGFDLASMDLTRGRDHGTPPYVNILKLYKKNLNITKFKDLEPFISCENIRLLEKNYESVEDIDLYVGSILETPLKGTLLGPTTQLMMAKQFRRLMTADPYFYTNPKSPKPFSKRQLKEIKKANTNLLFCFNSGVRLVPEKATIPAPCEMISCNCLDQISYEPWRETFKPRKPY